MIHRTLLVVLVVTVGGTGCLSGRRDRRPPQPRSAKSPIRIGALVQLHGAFSFLALSELGRAEPSENLGPLTHMLAAFYDWKDPGDTLKEQIAFLQHFCADRLQASALCRSWRDAYWMTQKALYDDALAATQWYAASGKDVGSLKQLLERALGQLKERRRAMDERWPKGELPTVAWCRQASAKAAVLEWNHGSLWVNGMQIMSLGPVGLPRDPDARMALQSMIVAGTAVAEARRAVSSGPGKGRRVGIGHVSPAAARNVSGAANQPPVPRGTVPRRGVHRGGQSVTATRRPPSKTKDLSRKTIRLQPLGGGNGSVPLVASLAPGEVVLRLGKGLGWPGVRALLRLLAEVNLRRASVRVRGPGGLPCFVPLKLSSVPLRPDGRWIRLHADTVDVCSLRGVCHKLAFATARATTLAHLLTGPPRSAQTAGPVFVEAVGVDWSRVAELMARLWRAVAAPPTLWVGGVPSRSGSAPRSPISGRRPLGPPPLR